VKVRSVLKQHPAPAGSVYLDPVTTSEAAVLHDSAPQHPVVGDSNGRLAGERTQASGAGACGGRYCPRPPHARSEKTSALCPSPPVLLRGGPIAPPQKIVRLTIQRRSSVANQHSL